MHTLFQDLVFAVRSYRKSPLLAGRLRSCRGMEAHGVRIDQASGRGGVVRWTVHRANP